MDSYRLLMILCLVRFSAATESQIVGGRIAKPHSRKYMASLQFYGHHICGGFLIREDYVLTAAHCTQVMPMTVVLGAHDLRKKEPSQQRIHIERYLQHPSYRGQYDFDIMLLKLKQKTKLNNFVDIIDLPTEDKAIRAHKECTVAGWGQIQPGDDSPSDVLRETEELIQFNSECKKNYQHYFNSENMICTKIKKNGGSMCQGDSGGPLICKNRALGIAAFTQTNDCSNPKYPHAYTKVSRFLPWIKDVMGGLANASEPLISESQERSRHFN